MESNQSFEYTYSAQQQQEVEAIRRKYLPREEDKMQTLRALHGSATQKAQMMSIIIGVLGSLILGTGMSLCMTDLGALLGGFAMVIGVAVGLLGLVLVGLAYPVYTKTLKKERQKIAPEVLRLTEELLK